MGTVGEGDVDPGHPVVHGTEQGEGFIWQELQVAGHSSGMLPLNNVDHLMKNEETS